MSDDVFSLKDQANDLAVLVTTVNEETIPEITFMDRRTGQQVTMAADVFGLICRAIDTALDAEELLADEPELPFEPKLH